MPEKEKNMKIAAYEVRPDEKPVIESLCKEYGIELVSTPANLDPTTANMAVGCDGVTTLGQRRTAAGDAGGIRPGGLQASGGAGGCAGSVPGRESGGEGPGIY